MLVTKSNYILTSINQSRYKVKKDYIIKTTFYGREEQEEKHQEGEERTVVGSETGEDKAKNTIVILRVNQDCFKRHQEQAETYSSQHVTQEHPEPDQDEITQIKKETARIITPKTNHH
jgi:hypothetical protein